MNKVPWASPSRNVRSLNPDAFCRDLSGDSLIFQNRLVGSHLDLLGHSMT